MNWSVVFAPLVPWTWLAAGGAVALAIVVAFALQRRRGTFVRFLGFAALIAALANPTLKQEERQGLSNIALVVVDRSASQSIAGRRELAAKASVQLAERLKRIGNLEVRTIEAGRDTTGNRDGTALFAAVETALEDIPTDRLAGVIVISDGQIHDVKGAQASLGSGVPVHAIITGAPGEFDRRIRVTKAPRYGIVGSTGEIRFKIEATGNAPAAQAPALVRIRREGENDDVLTVTPGEEISLPLPFPRAGTNIVELDLEAVAGELTRANNRAIISARGVRENLRVLLVSGEPHAGERTWRNLLKSDAAVDLVHFTILRPPEKQDGTPINQLSLIAFPTRELFQEKLHDFDLVIFDRYQRRGVLPLPYLQNITDYVEHHGGAVLVAAGEGYAAPLSLFLTPLADVLPAEPTGRVLNGPFKPRITDAGHRHPVTRGLPGAGAPASQTAPRRDPSWGRWFRLVEVESPATGRVVMQGTDDKPLLVLDRRGEGRVALLLSDHAWLWARGLEGGGPHTPLLRRLAHWLMKEPDLEEEFLSATGNAMAITIERRSMEEAVEPVDVIGPDGKSHKLTLERAQTGVWRGTLEAETPGLYKMRSGTLTAVARAGDQNSREMAEVTATADKLKPLLEATGGGAFWLKRAGGAALDVPRINMLRSAAVMHGRSWLGLRDRRAYLTTGIRLIPLFTGLAGLAALLLIVGAMWWREGR